MSVIYSLITQGLKPVVVSVEISATRGKPGFILIGLADRAMHEARERIDATFQSLGLRIPCKKIVVNLAPADVHKKNSHLELAVAVSLLMMMGLVKRNLSKTLFLGELSLDGKIRPIKGALVMTLAAQKLGFKEIILPQDNLGEVSLVKGIKVCLVSNFQEVLEYARGKGELLELSQLSASQKKLLTKEAKFGSSFDISQIRGQWLAKRALEIAAAGAHNLLLVGPPGSGKTMLAQALASILPPLSESEILEITQIYSLRGLTSRGLITQRPVRSPHHSISKAGLVGGGFDLQPGELSLAHRGVLFLDELPEFNRGCIEAMRQPLETGQVELARSSGQTVYPAQFTLLAAANPCPCGYLGTSNQVCHCSPYQIMRYQQKISGPIKDRIDLHLSIGAVDTDDLAVNQKSSKPISPQIRMKVTAARYKQKARLNKFGLSTNSQLNSALISQVCHLTKAAQSLLSQAARQMGLSARSYYKVIAVAQTITDLDNREKIEKGDISEALTYRY